ncbi:MAG: pyridoxal phosphate-dependent decarboxylase family protein [Prochlorothrix sp.]
MSPCSGAIDPASLAPNLPDFPELPNLPDALELPNLPAAAFVDPWGHNFDSLRPLFQASLDLILHHLSHAAALAPLPSPPPELAQLVATPPLPDQGRDFASLLPYLHTAIAGSMNPAHPGYLGHMDPPATTVSILGDWITAALNNNMLSVEMSPVFSRLEPEVLRSLAELFGLGAEAGGLLLSGGTLANLQALTVARNVKLGGVMQGGLAQWSLGTGLGADRPGQPVIFASEVAHTSWQKAAMVTGLGVDGVVAVAVNDRSQLDLADLKTKFHSAITAGQRPFALIATAGTTVTGNIDLLADLATFAHSHHLWFHVDAAYGGALVFCDRERHRLQGIEAADSVTFNPQKWLYVTKTCAAVLFRKMEHLDTAFRVGAPYMAESGDVTNLGELSVQGTRHPDILKLWLSLQHLGRSGYGALITASYHRMEYFKAGLLRRSFLNLASEPEMNILCFRGEPPQLDPQGWDQWNQGLQRFLLQEHQIFLSLPRYRGSLWLKAVLLNPYTDEAVFDRLLAAIDAYHQTYAAV